MDRIFGHVGDYSAGPRPYPDQDPRPGPRASSTTSIRRCSLGDLMYLIGDMRRSDLFRQDAYSLYEIWRW